MKKTFYFASLILALALSSCAKEELTVSQSEGTQIEAFLDDTKTVLDGLKVKWTTADSIVVNGIASTAISVKSDATKASFTVEGVSSPYYAVYPASAYLADSYDEASAGKVIVPEKQAYVAGSFDPAAAIMVGSGTDNITFKHAMAYLKVTVSGTTDTDAIKAIEVSAIGNENMSGEFSCTEDGALSTTAVTGNDVTLYDASGIAQGTAVIIAIPARNYASGIRLVITDINGDCAVVKSTKAFEAKAGHIYPTAVTFAPAGRKNLSVDGTANCYMVNASGVYMIKAVKGNSNEKLINAASAAPIWEYTIFGGTNTITGKDVYCENGYLIFNTGSTMGNAGIAAKDSEGNIIWSWHIWSIASNPEVQLGTTVTLKYALGYIDWASNDAYSFGMAYQWGRKDPFPIQYCAVGGDGFKSIDVNESGVIGADGTAQDYAIANPATFILGKDENTQDWYAVTQPNQNSNLWGCGSVKTVNDPCPVGYKVPAIAFYQQFTGADFTTEADGTTTHRIAKDGVWFLYSGSLIYNTETWSYDGVKYWSASVNGPFAYDCYALGAYYDSAHLAARATGMAVRCVKE